MTKKLPVTVKCPHCGKELVWEISQLFRPFCSERCKLIDLGEWVMEEHKIPGNILVSDDKQE